MIIIWQQYSTTKIILLDNTFSQSPEVSIFVKLTVWVTLGVACLALSSPKIVVTYVKLRKSTIRYPYCLADRLY